MGVWKLPSPRKVTAVYRLRQCQQADAGPDVKGRIGAHHTKLELSPRVTLPALIGPHRDPALPEVLSSWATLAEYLPRVRQHGYDLARRVGGLPAPEQVAADWYDTVYRRGCDAVCPRGLPELYAS